MATRLKTKASAAPVPQSKDACAADIRTLGDVQRQFERIRAEMNDAIATLTQRYQPVLEAQSEQAQALQAGIQAWCEANRSLLCGPDDRLGKTANLVTGTVAWRARPPSVGVRGAETVIETLQRMGLGRYVRDGKPEVNKEAILNDPNPVRGIAGISIASGVEDFVITPFEAQAEVAA